MSSNYKKVGIALIVVIIAGVAGYKFLNGRQEEEAPTYNEYIVKKGNLKIQILSTGIVQPENKVEIKAPIAGRLEKVLVQEGTRVKKGQILAWMSSTERAAMLDAASAKGPQEVKDWEEMYRATPILAAIDGMIIQKNYEAGQTFTTADAILVMSDRLTVKAQVDETDIAKIKLKQKAEITLDAYPDETIEASVDQIAYDAKTVNNVTTYIVDVLPNKTPVYMRSGMTANVTFDVDSRSNILLVPTEAIKIEDVMSAVLLPNPNNAEKPIEHEVEIGLSDGKKTEILSGLNENDKILVQSFKAKGKQSSGVNPFSPMGRRSGSGSRGAAHAH